MNTVSKPTLKTLILCAAVAGLLPGFANAANITWQTPVNISGTSDVNTQGTLHGTWAPGDDWRDQNGNGQLADNYPVNGVTFRAYGTSGVNFNCSGAGIDLDRYNGFANPNTGDGNYDLLLQTAQYNRNSGSSDMIISWGNLIVGHTYLVQAWLNDGRGCCGSGTSTFTGGANTSAAVAIGNGVPGQYIIGTFVADSSSQSFTMSPGIMLNLVQVRDISPTPNVTWGASAAISGPSDVITNGNYFGSWAPYNQDAFNNGSAGLVVNGTKFVASTDLPNFFTVGFNNGYNGYNNPNTSDANYNDLLQTAAYEGNGDGRPVSLSWTGMLPGHTYQIQIWANDGRGNSRTESFTGGSNTSATVNFGDAPGRYIVGTFVADAAGRQVISLSAAGSPNGSYPQVNLIQVRDLTTAADIAWQAPATISGTSDVNTQGMFAASWAPGDDYGSPNRSDDHPVNGVTFGAYGIGANFGFSGAGINMDRYNGFANPGTPDADYNYLLTVAAFNWNAGSSDMIVSWNNMKVGHTYLVQAWLNDGRGSQPGTSTFTGGVSNSAPVAIGDGAPGQYITGTFVANRTDQSFKMSPGIMLNLLQIRDLTPPPPQPRITSIGVNGATLNLSATNGAHSGSYVLLGTTNVTTPLSQWTPILTNSFNSSGNLNLSTNVLNPAVPLQFFILSQ